MSGTGEMNGASALADACVSTPTSMEREVGVSGRFSMRLSVQVPRSMMEAIPDPQGVVTDYDELAMYRDFRKVAEPRELLGQLTNLFVVISRHRKDFLAANLLAVLQRFRLGFASVRIRQRTEPLLHCDCLYVSDAIASPTSSFTG